MTIEQLCGLSADEWQHLPIEKLHSFLEPYLKVTRPEYGRLEDKKVKSKYSLLDVEMEKMPASVRNKPQAWKDTKKMEAMRLIESMKKEINKK